MATWRKYNATTQTWEAVAVVGEPGNEKAHRAKFNFSPYTEAITANADAVTAAYEVVREPAGTLQYVGGICVNGKIYCAPNTADNILVYDTVNDYSYTIGGGFGTQPYKYTGFVYWHGYLYAIPRGVNNMLRVDPMTDDVEIIPLTTTYPISPYGDYRDSHHYGGVISDSGYMYLPPAYASDKLLKINMADFTHEELAFESEDTETWIGCAKHPTEDKILFLGGKVIRVWDCETDTFTDIKDGTNRACYDLVYDPRFNCMYGAYPNGVFALMLDDYSIVDSGWINYQETGYGIALGIDGWAYHLEGKFAFRYLFDGTAWETYNMSYMHTESDVGSTTPILAGMALANDGSIYGIPASGAMTRLKFEGAVRRLPDYIVASQHYGKY